MLRRRLGMEHEVSFLDTVLDEAFEIVDLQHADYSRVADLVETYGNLNLGFVDAAIVAVAERLNVTRVATLNYRDFAIVEPSHTKHLTLLPQMP